PLAKLEIKDLGLNYEYIHLIKEELNLKEVTENKNLETEVLLDTKITGELKEEGEYRELVRAIQDMRKKQGLTPKDIIFLLVETDEKGKKLIRKFELDLKKTILASKIDFAQITGMEARIDDLVFKIQIDRI